MAIYLQINKNDRIRIEPTIFPDKTSQVWKVPQVDNIKEEDNIYIYWVFEQEAEFIWLMQLSMLIRYPIIYIIPYLPYARQDNFTRQDNKVFNDRCFASVVFQKLFRSLFNLEDTLHILDVHSVRSYEYIDDCDGKVINHIPYDKIKRAFDESKSNLMLLPDFGAFNRYYQAVSHKATHCIKDRDQATGKINSITLPDDVDFKNKKVLIVDDICDGGGTFIEIAKQLNERGVMSINLYVTHDLHTKGKQILFDAGIACIYRTDYELFYQGIVNES